MTDQTNTRKNGKNGSKQENTMNKTSLRDMLKGETSEAVVLDEAAIDQRSRFTIKAIKSGNTGATYRVDVIQNEERETLTLNRMIPVMEAFSALVGHFRLGAYPTAEPGLHVGTRKNSPDLPIGYISSDHDPEIFLNGKSLIVSNMPTGGYAPLYVFGNKANAGPEISFGDANSKVIWEDAKTGKYPAGSRTGNGYILEKDARIIWYHAALDWLLSGDNLSLHVATREDNGGGSWPYVQKLMASWDAETLEEAQNIANQGKNEAARRDREYRGVTRLVEGKKTVDISSFIEKEGEYAGKVLLTTLSGKKFDPETLEAGQKVERWFRVDPDARLDASGKVSTKAVRSFIAPWSSSADYQVHAVDYIIDNHLTVVVYDRNGKVLAY